MQIEKLTWDTEFFGFKVGRVTIYNEEDFHPLEFKKQAIDEKFELIYVFKYSEMLSWEKVIKADLEMIDNIKLMRESIRYFPTMVKWVGFNVSFIDVEHNYRIEGRSGYSIRKLIRLAFDMIVSFSEKPLRLGLKFGILISCLSFLLGIYYFILYISGNIIVPGYASLIISIAFSTGIIITFLGLIGMYIGKISVQVKERPRYICKQKVNI